MLVGMLMHVYVMLYMSMYMYTCIHVMVCIHIYMFSGVIVLLEYLYVLSMLVHIWSWYACLGMYCVSM